MNNMKDSATWEDLVGGARQRTRRRLERFDTLVAAVLLLLLIFGWAVSLAPMARWPGAHILSAGRQPHA
ncbi:MAG: hypothetical protein J2P50_19150 [Hyphomicrobiaceae bacterium]|nr:hypothetical protein [Hyphomicrobiaceae bacterium]